jgi:hypothetical protein
MEDLKVFPWLKDFQDNLIDVKTLYEFSSYETKILREELQIVHNTYKNEIKNLDMELDIKDDKISEYEKLIYDCNIELEILKDENVLTKLKTDLLINSREEWIGRSLKFHYLFKEMDKIGLKQSEFILEAYKDIEMPLNEIPMYIKEKYIPTMLTNTVDLDSDSDITDSDSDITDSESV